MAKPNLKSVRMSDEVLQIVENFQGEGFNQKFENIVLHFHKSEPARQKQLKELDKFIKEQEARLAELRNQIRAAFEVANTLKSMQRQVLMMEADFKQLFSISKDEPGHAAAG